MTILLLMLCYHSCNSIYHEPHCPAVSINKNREHQVEYLGTLFVCLSCQILAQALHVPVIHVFSMYLLLELDDAHPFKFCLRRGAIRFQFHLSLTSRAATKRLASLSIITIEFIY